MPSNVGRASTCLSSPHLKQLLLGNRTYTHRYRQRPMQTAYVQKSFFSRRMKKLFFSSLSLSETSLQNEIKIFVYTVISEPFHILNGFPWILNNVRVFPRLDLSCLRPPELVNYQQRGCPTCFHTARRSDRSYFTILD